MGRDVCNNLGGLVLQMNAQVIFTQCLLNLLIC